MRKKQRAGLLLLLCLCLSLLLSACTREELPALQKMSPITYSHISGYEIQMPDAWTPETSDNGVQFLNPEGTIAINIISELGGMDFYSLDELMEMVVENLTQNGQDMQVEGSLDVADSGYQRRQLISYTNAAEEKIYTDIWLYEPMAGIRYYIIISCGGDDYKDYSGMFDSVVQSFVFTGNSSEVYTLLNLPWEELAEKMKTGLQEVH